LPAEQVHSCLVDLLPGPNALELPSSPCCPHFSFGPTNEHDDCQSAANVVRQLDEEPDKLLDGWQQTLLENLDAPIIRAHLDLLKVSDCAVIRKLVA
jgi:hypothetical protein